MINLISKHYWWLVPLLFCFLGSLTFLSYNFLPIMGTFTTRRLISGMSIILFIPLVLGFVISVFIFGYKVIRKHPFSSFLKLCLVSPIMFMATIFISGTINESVPIPRLDPYMRLNQYSQKTWEIDKSLRRTTVEDLVKNVLPNKNCIEVENLLGKSLDKNFGTSAAPFKCYSNDKSELRYFLGSQGFWGEIDNIQVFFDGTGTYSHYEIYTYDF